jgi:hypothetical protein
MAKSSVPAVSMMVAAIATSRAASRACPVLAENAMAAPTTASDAEAATAVLSGRNCGTPLRT